MKLQVGRYVVTGPVLRLFFFAFLLIGVIVGVLSVLHEDGKSTGLLPMLPGILLITKLMKNAFADFKNDNQLD